jgi:2,3-bisphosphoglycerate-dependent phosphoglycerate mutase
VPFFCDRIQKHLIAGDNVLVAAHGNSLRSIIKYLENLSEEEIVKVELGTAVPIVYDIDGQGQTPLETTG